MKTTTTTTAGTAVAAPDKKQGLPAGTPDQIIKGALKLQAQRQKIGVHATTVNESTATRGTAYDRKTRTLMLTLAKGLDQSDTELVPVAQAIAKALGVDPKSIRDNLDRQQVAWDGFRNTWAIRGAVRAGRRVVDGTRRLARGTVEADVERFRAGQPPAVQQRLDDDFRDYQDAGAEDLTARNQARKLTKDILDAGQQQIGDFHDRRQLVETLDRLSMGPNENLPWDELVKAGNTLDKLTGQQDTAAPAPGHTRTTAR